MDCCSFLLTTIKQMVSPPGQTPLNAVVMTILFLGNFANAMIITLPFSFLPKMMREFGVKEKEIGYYVGLVASSLYIGRSIGSYIWGWLCDHIGRKSSLNISAVLVLICTLLFGFSQSFAWAMSFRLLQGAFGGMIIALKATVFALCDETNNSLGMAIILSSYQIGLIVGPAVGGYLVFPAETFPNTFSKDSIFAKFPFLLPNLITCIILAISILMFFFKVPETLKKNSEETKLLRSTSVEKKPFKNTKSNIEQYLDLYSYDMRFSRETYTVLSVKPEDESGNNFENHADHPVSVTHFQILDDNHLCSLQRTISKPSTTCCKSFKESSLWHLLSIRSVQVSLGLYAIFSFITVGFDETFPIFADSSKKYGGLAFSSSEIGTAVLLAASPMIILVFFLARMTHRFGEKKVLIATLYVMIVGLPLFPYVARVPNGYVWYVLIPFLVVERLSMSAGFMAVNILLNNAADAKYMGLVNGLGMTASCVFRAISPSVLGALFSWSLKNEGRLGFPFNHVFPFVLCSFIALLTVVNAVFLPDKIPPVKLSADSETFSESATLDDNSKEVNAKV